MSALQDGGLNDQRQPSVLVHMGSEKDIRDLHSKTIGFEQPRS